MGYLEIYRIFVPELRRSLHIAKYRNEQKSARFHIESKPNLERVSNFNNSRWENENAEKSPDSGAKSCFFRHFCHHYRAFGKWNLLSCVILPPIHSMP